MAALEEMQDSLKNPVYACPDLPDMRAAIQADIGHKVDDPESTPNRIRALLDED